MYFLLKGSYGRDKMCHYKFLHLTMSGQYALGLTLSCTFTWAPPERSLRTWSVYPWKLAWCRTVWPNWENKENSKVV